MQNNYQNQQRGLIKLIILIVVVVLILSYFGINIQRIAESDAGKQNFAYVWHICQQIGDWAVNLYHQYLAAYVNKLLAYLPKGLVK